MKHNRAEAAFWRTVTSLFLVSGLAIVGCKAETKSDSKKVKQATKGDSRNRTDSKNEAPLAPDSARDRARTSDVFADEGEKALEEVAKGADMATLSMNSGRRRGGSRRPSRRTRLGAEAPMSPAPKKGKKKGGKKRPAVKTWKRAKSIPNTSRLKIGDNQELPLQGMQATVHVDGFRARVLLDCYFLNDRNRQYEGTFQVRLPNGAAPYFFAFGESTWAADDSNIDKAIFQSQEQARKMGTSVKEVMIARQKTWNKPKEARMVPKAKAAYAYKETVRQRVDPALMEWAGAGVFNARVFPLAAKKIHRIVIGYDVNLLPVGSGLEYRLDIPSKKSKCVVDLFVKSLAGSNITIEPKAEADKARGNLYYRFEKANLSSVVLRYNASGPVLLRGNDPKIGDTFAATFEAPIPATENLAGNDHGVFLVDTSLSGNPERFNVWLKMLGALLENNRSTMKKFNVLFFNIETFWWKSGFQDNTESNVKELLKYADSLALEGATDLGAALREGCAPKWSKAPVSADCFLLSDGAVTWGESEQYGLSNILKDSKTTLFAYKTGFAGTNQALLTHLTRESGGSVFSVVGEAQIASASVAHKKRPWLLESIAMKDGQDLLLAGRPQCLFPGQQLTLAGRGKGGDIITIKARQGKTIKTFQVNIPAGSQLTSSLAPRVYGQIAVSQIEDFNDFKSVSGIAKAYA
ncbi:MAG: hypothetical protein P1V97_34025, partial [Planctomycetota bacterium]|nr:hypothetical protein [Planctomycetota bacterium]